MEYHIDFDGLRQEHEELMAAHDWVRKIPWWRRLLMRLFRSRNVSYWAEDTTVAVHCVCGEELFANDAWIEWCPKCGRGYKTELCVYVYPPFCGEGHG